MLTNTQAIVLRTVPYGDTSLVVTAFTEAYGLQSYLVKGARSTGKKGQSLRPYLQPGAWLDLVVYHHQTSQLQYIRDMQWANIWQRVLTSVVHNAIATFIVELVSKCIRETETNKALFESITQYLTLLDEADPPVVANIALHFALFLAGEMGFRPEDNYDEHHPVFDLKEGCFTADLPVNPEWALTGSTALLTHELLMITHPVTLYRVKMHQSERRFLLDAYIIYFSLHAAGFGSMRSPEILKQLF